MSKPPPKPPPKMPSKESLGIETHNASAVTPIFLEISKCFKNDRVFHENVVNKDKFMVLLSHIGNVPFTERGVIAKNLATIIELNSRLLQDNAVFKSIIQIMRNLPPKSKDFQALGGKIMLKLRETLIKNQKALNLFHKPMASYSETIRDFLSLIPIKPKTSFLNSFAPHITDFILGKISKEQRSEQNKKNQERINKENKLNKSFDDDEDEDDIIIQDKMQRLVKMMFSDVMRLEPELVSAVILSLITQLPHGNMIIEDKATRNNLMQHLNI